MDGYMEQSVAGRRTPGRAVLYALCWALIAALVLAALVLAAGAISRTEAGPALRWPELIGALACLGLAALVFYRKDYLRLEYDYVLRSGALEVWAILNLRRRRRLAQIPLERLSRMGPARGADFEGASRQPGLKRHAWHVETGALIYLCYTQENVRHMALLELNAEMTARIRGSGRLLPGVWRDEEEKRAK